MTNPHHQKSVQSGSRSAYAIIAAIGLLAMVARILPFATSGTSFAMSYGDSPRYSQLAHGIAAGCGLAIPTGQRCSGPEVLRTPGYPLFLAASGSLATSIVVSSALAGVICSLIGLQTAQIWGTRAGLIASAMFAGDLPSICVTSQIMSDALFQALIAAAVIIQVRAVYRRTWINSMAALLASALLYGLAALVRPVAEFLWIVAWVPVLFMTGWPIRRKIIAALATTAIAAAPALAWASRNYRTVGVFTLSTAGAVNLYYVIGAATMQEVTPGPILQIVRELGNGVGPVYMDAPASSEAAMNSRAIRIIEAHPVAFAKVMLLSALRIAIAPEETCLRSWAGSTATDVGEPWYRNPAERIKGLIRPPALLFAMIFQLALLGFMWCGVALAVKKLWFAHAGLNMPLIVLPLLTAMLILALSAGPQGNAGRLRMPAVPLLAIVAAVGWCVGATDREEVPIA